MISAILEPNERLSQRITSIAASTFEAANAEHSDGEIASFLEAAADVHGMPAVTAALDELRSEGARFELLVSAAAFLLDRNQPNEALAFAEAAYALRSADLRNSRLLDRARRAALGLPDSKPKQAGFCRKPFQNFETGSGGQVYLCCPGWLPKPVGNLYTQSWQEIWNSEAAQEIRASIHDGSYRHCNPVNCPVLGAGALEDPTKIVEPELRAIVEQKVTAVGYGPKLVNLSHDSSCNLACPSCRTEKHVAKGKAREYLMDLADKVVLPLVNETPCIVNVTGSGDPFGSQHFRYVIKHLAKRDYPNLNLQTNGLLFDERAWTDLGLEGKVKDVQVSMDASSDAVYKVVRRYGDFRRLLQNLRFISSLRHQGRFSSLRLDFVVQTENFADMPGFVGIGRALGVDHVSFNGITNWGTFSAEAFAKQAIWSSAHPRFEEFLSVLRSPTLEWDRIWWGSLLDLVGLARRKKAA